MDRYHVQYRGRTYVVSRRRRPVRRTFDDDDDDDDYHGYRAPYLPGTRAPIILDHDPRDVSAPYGGGHESSRANKRARVAEAAIQGLPEVTMPPPNKMLRSPAAECAVCLKEFDELDTLRAMPCAHAFHEDCIFRWLRLNATCPLCRHPLPAPTTQEDDKAQETD
ncbi:hypothetical protein PR202_gb16527 [Eleusine coracana subsp. coracana]|uniref:RING-type E3 ubiquitin transferase n=1 Tax=Eleusine coracana subsp. coracana TaxID=191504 RepID=A0AAV5EYC1_ELECO|nr:hypothetical protein QOZ80_9BG0697020 [Eleusine coracana subsp. coracana]GJN28409.1 hypothetical protein PR202_gb16527 [Eleusine coracana subsp. coracana]